MDTRLGWSFLLLACFTLFHRISNAESPSEMANVLAGTINNYDISTGGNMPLMARPFGFNHWSVATTMRDGRLDFSPASSDFYGILCTHQPSWWIGDYGYFLILPNVNTPFTSFITLPGASFFRPDQTVYRPYYFRTSLVNSAPVAGYGYVVTEMTPTDHAAALRFRFVSKGKKQIIFRNSRDLVLLSKPDEVSRIVFTTNVNSGGVPANFRMFVVIDAKPLPVSVTLDTSLSVTLDTSLSRDAVLSFDVVGGNSTTTVVEVRVATSFISEAQAWLNLRREAPWTRTFDFLKEQGKGVWDERMSSIEIDPGVNSYNFRRTFYTNYYRSLLFPRLLTELNETDTKVHYSPYTGRVHPGELAADSGFWDSYNTVYLWLDLAAPDVLARLLEGWVNAYKEAGWLPTWPSPGERQSMIGTMGDVVFAWAIVSGKASEEAKPMMYQAIRQDAFGESSESSPFGRACSKYYDEKGFFPPSECPDSVSRALMNMVADSAIAFAADKLGMADDAAVLRTRVSRAVDANWNPELAIFGPRDEAGNWYNISIKSWSSQAYTEGGALQYRFCLPFDVPRLVGLHGGREKFCEAIRGHFTDTTLPLFEPSSLSIITHEQKELSLISDRFGQYAHNNQPSHHVLGVALAAGCTTVADEYMRRVLEELYSPDAWSGDEDNGEMSAWFLLNAIGLYMIDFGKDELLLFSPMVVGSVHIKSMNLLIESYATIDTSCSRCPFVCSVRWFPYSLALSPSSPSASRSLRGWQPMRGQLLSNRTIARSEVEKGGRLLFELSPNPCSTVAS